jgi:AcrR family transcriptional regulator
MTTLADPAVSLSGRPLRKQSARARTMVLQATRDLLLDGGLKAATVDAISARSGVSKATMYKHWANRTMVAIDAFADYMSARVPLPDTGSTRGDLTAHLVHVGAFYASPAGAIYAQLLAQAVDDPGARDLLIERFLEGRRQVARLLWQRGLDRGDVRGDVDVEVAIDVLSGPIIFRLIAGHAPLDRAYLEAIADAALGGLLVVNERSPKDEETVFHGGSHA